ncbi:MAG: phosphoesterase RecJ-like protein [Planctomycetota bacterium]|jgi:phosphoesterase RecJ-like protein
MTTSKPERTEQLDDSRARALEVLRVSKSFLLTGHQRPDGDCIGAQAALARVLESLGARVHIVNPDPPEERYHYLSNEIEYGVYHEGDVLPEHDVCILLDCSELSRCGDLGTALGAVDSAKMVIDHHPHETSEWWSEAYRDVSASATGLLIHRIAGQLGVTLDAVACKGVFTSMVTDTGWFKYSNTDAETLRAAAQLIDAGLDPDEMYRAIYQAKPADHPTALAKILDRLTYYADGRLGVLDVPLDAGLDSSRLDSEDALDLVRAVSTVEVVLFLKEVEPKRWKLSARSKTTFDVNRLARQFGGGGHAKAAGAMLDGDFEGLRASIIRVAAEGLSQDASSSGPLQKSTP